MSACVFPGTGFTMTTEVAGSGGSGIGVLRSPPPPAVHDPKIREARSSARGGSMSPISASTAPVGPKRR